MTLAPTVSLPLPNTGGARSTAPVRIWLYVVALMIVAMVLVGGITRLTHSGLSITEWKPIHGVIPPLNETEWQDEFAKYRQIPEYKVLNQGMSLSEFKGIFFWEWTHRLLGRLIGVVFFVPMVWFWATGRVSRQLKPQLVVLFVLGGLQGAIGWWMVASGLVERTDVSQYRLATHFTFACLIFAYTVWVARGLAPVPARPATIRGGRGLAVGMVVLLFLQLYLGGLVAGLDAGVTYNTWPLMDGRLVPVDLLPLSPVWHNFFETIQTVQFDHRMTAYAIVILSLVQAFLWLRRAGGSTPSRSAAAVALVALAQAGLGIATLLTVVPLHLALTHQIGAVVLLATMVAHLRIVTPRRGA